MKKEIFLEQVAKIKAKLKSGKKGLLELQQDAKQLRNQVDDWKKKTKDTLEDIEKRTYSE